MKSIKYIIFCCLLFFLILYFFIGNQSLLPIYYSPAPSRIYDINGRLLGSAYKESHEEVKIENVAPSFIEAVIAIEDIRYYQHKGLDFRSILRAIWVNLKEARIVEGGSTITQQTVKNLYLTSERTWSRKIKEIYYALILEKQFTKKEILELYINHIYFGHGAYGVQMASKMFFGKTAQELTLEEATLLAGVIRAPESYSPYRYPDLAQKRRNVVINRMVELGYLLPEKAEQIKKKPVQVIQKGLPLPFAAYIIDEVRGYLADNYSNGTAMFYRGGLSIYTTIDYEMQKAAEEAMIKGLNQYDFELEGALIAIEPGTGYIKAMVGGRRYNQGEYNRALKAKRQPGSAFKPFLYTAAIDIGFTAADMIKCEPVAYLLSDGSVYQPRDYGTNPYHYRDLTLKEALMVSDNVVAVRLNNMINPYTTKQYAERMGIKSPLRPYLSLALGTSEVTPLEMAAAYATLASGGLYADPLIITKITDREGQVIESKTSINKTVLDNRTAFIVTDMLKGVLEGGTGAHLCSILQRPAAGKTGTTQEDKDAWFVGFTPDLCAAVYIGYDLPDRSAGKGGVVAGPIWANFMKDALKKTPKRDFPIPSDIVIIDICAESGKPATSACPRVLRAAFRKGTQPVGECPVHSTGFNQWLFSEYRNLFVSPHIRIPSFP